MVFLLNFNFKLRYSTNRHAKVTARVAFQRFLIDSQLQIKITIRFRTRIHPQKEHEVEELIECCFFCHLFTFWSSL